MPKDLEPPIDTNVTMSSAIADERRDLAVAASNLAIEVSRLGKKLTLGERIRKRQTLTLVIIAFLVALLGLGLNNQHSQSVQNRDLSNQNQSRATCLAKWADQYTDRANTISTRSKILQDATDRVFRSIQFKGTPAQRQAAFASAYANYINVSNQYKKAQADNPIPPAPKLQCK